MISSVFALLLASVAMLGSPLVAQERSGPLIPSGLVRFEMPLVFEGWDRRWGPDGRDVPLGSDFSSEQIDAGVFPGIAALEEALELADPGGSFPIDMGATDVYLYRERTVVPLSLTIGVFDWLSIGGTAPFSKRRAEIFVEVDGSEAGAGVSPALTAPTAVSDFLGQFRSASEQLHSAAESVCADSGAQSSACEEATRTAGEVGDFQSALEAAYTTSAAFPFAETEAAAALQARLQALGQEAAGLGVSEVPTELPLADRVLDDETFSAFVSGDGGSLQAEPLADWRSPWEMGDVELFAHLRLLGSPVLERRQGEGTAWELGVGVLTRLGTGTPDSPDNLIDLGSGDGTMDFEGRAFLNLRANDRLGLWLDAVYGVQGGIELVRRITPPDRPLAPLTSRKTVSWTPGSYLRAEFVPRLHLTDQVALSFSVLHLDRQADEYAAVGGSGGHDVSVLEEGTARRLTQIGAGVSFSSLLAGSGHLMEARFRYLKPISASEGIFPKNSRLEMGIRLFRRFWGEPRLR